METITVKELIERVIEELENIKVPIAEVDAIGIPIAGCINNLKNCIEAFRRAEAEQRKAQEQGDGIRIEMEPGDENDT